MGGTARHVQTVLPAKPGACAVAFSGFQRRLRLCLVLVVIEWLRLAHPHVSAGLCHCVALRLTRTIAFGVAHSHSHTQACTGPGRSLYLFFLGGLLFPCTNAGSHIITQRLVAVPTGLALAQPDRRLVPALAPSPGRKNHERLEKSRQTIQKLDPSIQLSVSFFDSTSRSFLSRCKCYCMPLAL